MISLKTLALFAFGVALTASPVQAAPGDADGDGIPDPAEALLGTDSLTGDTDGDGLNDKDDQKPLEVADPIPDAGKSGGLVIRSAKVEDNMDPKTRRDVADHLEIELRNPGTNEIKGLQVFFSIKDDKGPTMESYYRNLPGFTIKAGGSRALHFDLKGATDWTAATDHFRSNENSMLYKTPNSKTVTIKVAADGYAPSHVTIKKDEGMEVPD
jgi:hypothetical protein